MGYDFHLTPAGPAPDRGQHQRGRRAPERAPHRSALRPGAARVPVRRAPARRDDARRASARRFRAEHARARPGRRARARRDRRRAPRARSSSAPSSRCSRSCFERAGVAAEICDTCELAPRPGARAPRRASTSSTCATPTRARGAAQRARCAPRTWRASRGDALAPREHHLLADKRRLALFSSPAALARARRARPTDAALPRRGRARDAYPLAELGAATRVARRGATGSSSPAAAFGSRAVYRGDKLTRRKLEEILADRRLRGAAPGRARRDRRGHARGSARA